MVPFAAPARRLTADPRLPPADALRKGWCPGALRPMEANDGWLVRLRIAGGIIPEDTAKAIADLAVRHGNGLFDLSARGNLQIRGVGAAGWQILIEGLATLGLIDEDSGAESVRNVMASPLAGLHPGLDIRTLVRDLEAALTRDQALHRLPTKFGFLVDDGSEPALQDVAADVRFDALPGDGTLFSVGLGGTRASALRIGVCAADDLVARATEIGKGAIDLFSANEARRMRGLIDTLGEASVAQACGGACQAALRDRADRASVALAGSWQVSGWPVLGLAAPFGRLDAAMLRLAARHARDELRLTPWRTILLPGVRASAAGLTDLRRSGFILDPQDPRLAVSACVGRDGCARGTTWTQADASQLAPLAAASGSALHVSGCAKGCAHAGPAPITLVGRDGRYDLILDGRAGDRPVAFDLDLAQVRAIMAHASPAL